jgi:hypothetical protein
MGAGALTAAVVFAWLSWAHFPTLKHLGTWWLVAVGVALYAPALAQPFVQKKAFKIVSRFLLGVAIVCLWYAALVLLPLDVGGVALRGLFVAVFVMTWHLTQRFRARWTARPCDRCPDGVYPFCLGNRPRLAALFAGLQNRARPEDRPFVDLVASIAGLRQGQDRIELMAITQPSP